jgi:hypothetical protein
MRDFAPRLEGGFLFFCGHGLVSVGNVPSADVIARRRDQCLGLLGALDPFVVVGTVFASVPRLGKARNTVERGPSVIGVSGNALATSMRPTATSSRIERAI